METGKWLSETGIIITIVLIIIPVIVSLLIVAYKIHGVVKGLVRKRELEKFNEYLRGVGAEELKRLAQKEKALELLTSGDAPSEQPSRSDGLITNIRGAEEPRFVPKKKRSQPRPNIDPTLSRLILWYLGCSVFWLLFGTTIGEYVGIKFVAPDIDHSRWLSFGRLRPVHTNAVFWGWASMAMVGLAYYVVPRISNTRIVSIRIGYYSLILFNASVVLGSVSLMAGVNNGGGEYREYIWPAMLPFAIALWLTFRNFYKTVATRKVGEIYISNWYILAALVWTLVLATIGYLPWYQDGLGETVIQGYYMHQGVGMWFMTFTLGLLYYYLPSALNKPIYSYSLGVLAFWTQMLFYTMIGTHHFVFAPLPWWLQTVAIVFSAGMFIPVVAGTTNFLMTMRGSWSAIATSYVLPFFLVAVIFYFVGSSQGSLQAFRFTNHVWHFTDFNVAHSHMTMYGIITFALWACVYAILPRITGREPAQLLVGAHFWTAFIGLFAYMISLMAGGTIKGLMWIDGKPFIDSVTGMRPYWIWRAIGGSLMFLSHLLFAWNFFTMVRGRGVVKGEEHVRPVSVAPRPAMT